MTKRILLTAAAVLIASTAQATEVFPSSATHHLYVYPNSITQWRAPVSVDRIYVAGTSVVDNTHPAELTVTPGMTNRDLIINAGVPNEATVSQHNVLLLDANGATVANLVIEITPLGTASHQVTIHHGGSEPHNTYMRCNDRNCIAMFKTRQPSAVTTTIITTPFGAATSNRKEY